LLAISACVCFVVTPSFAQDDRLLSLWKRIESSLPGPGSQGFVMPSAVDMLEFEDSMQDLLRGRVRAAKLADRARQFRYSATVIGPYIVLADAAKHGQGIFILNQSYTRNLIVEAPHSVSEPGTAEEGLAILEKAGARALFLAGAHSCADLKLASGCSGAFSFCTDDPRFVPISDAGHSDRTLFNAAHNASLHMDPKPVTLSLHGNQTEPVPAVLSDGTMRAAADDSLVIHLRDALEKNGVGVASCNRAADEPSRLMLCGTGNVQGRESNGSPQACREDAKTASGLFLYLDQRPELLEKFDGVVQAVIDVVPVK
jgi:hypothetical protein